MTTSMKRGDIFYADLTPVKGSEQGGTRPVIIIQNDLGNRFSPTVIVAMITTATKQKQMPTHVRLEKEIGGLSRNSVVIAEQIRTIDKTRLLSFVGNIGNFMMQNVDEAVKISLGLVPINVKKVV